jgi:two-component system response regulator ResD
VGPSSAVRVLVVEDDPSVAEVVGRYLEREGFVVDRASDGREGLGRALAVNPGLVVLDLSLPGVDGLEVLRRLRALAPVPVVILTARGEESDRLQGLDLGADDYVVKPFSPRELVSRVRAVLRRTSGPGAGGGLPDVLCGGELEADPRAREVRVRGRPVALTAREFDLLVFLMSRRGRVCSRVELLEQLWGARHGDDATLTVHVRRLREKIEADPSAPGWIKTVWGVGYRFDG